MRLTKPKNATPDEADNRAATRFVRFLLKLIIEIGTSGQVGAVRISRSTAPCRRSKVKIPRWLLVGLTVLLVLALAATALVWVAWPDRTARRFLALIADGKFRT